MGSYQFNLPDIGEGLSEGEIVRWHVAPGDQVQGDQPLVDVETDKAVVEIPAPVAGVLKTQGGQPGDMLPVGGLLAVIETDGAAAEPAPAAPAQAESTEPAAVPLAAGEPAGPAKRVRASPATRKRAIELGVELATVTGTGDRGLVTKDDVERAAAGDAGAMPATPVPPSSAPVAAGPAGEDRVVPLRGLRRQVARTMAEAWREIPHIWSMRELEADELVRAYRSLRAEFDDRGVRLTYLAIFVKAAAMALRHHPSFNASIDLERQEIIYRHRRNIGLATATPDGLIVTVLHDADAMSLVLREDIESRHEEVVPNWRGRDHPRDLALVRFGDP